MVINHIRASGIFKNCIAGYATMSVEDKDDFSFANAALPDGFVELYFFNYGSVHLSASNSFSSTMNTGFMIGQTNKRIDFIPSGKLSFFTVKILPWAAKYFFNEKAIAYSNRIFFLSDFQDKRLLQLQEQILCASTTAESIGIIEKYLIERISRSSPYPKVVYNACNLIFNSKGLIEIKKISNLLNISNQYLERCFSDYVGLTPKQYARVVKIRALGAYQKANPNVSSTDLAYAFNYFDQSHFIKDIKSYVGETPRRFFKKNNFILKYFPFDD